MKTCGIYAIRNTINGKMYVGKSTNVPNRFIRHKTLLKNSKHFNRHLQRSYQKYGKIQFEYVLLEECEKNNLSSKEQEWIDKIGINGLYNHQLEVKDLHHDRNPFYGKTHTEKTKSAMSAAKKKLYIGSGNPNYGKKHSQETRTKMSEGRGRLDRNKVTEIVQLLKQDVRHQEIADKYNIARTAITRIANGTRWANVTGGPVALVVYVDGQRQFTDSQRQRIGNGRKGKKHSEETKAIMSEKAKNRKIGECL